MNYCEPNDDIIWKNGIMDGSISSTDTFIDYNFIICHEASFSVCGYVPLYSAEFFECGQPLPNSGVMFGTGINLLYQSNETLFKLGASTETIETLDTYYGLTASIAAETICNHPFTMNLSEAYNITVGFIDEYVSEIQYMYKTQRNNDTLPFIDLPLGIRTVMASIYWKWYHSAFFSGFWSNILLNNFEEAIKVLRSWYSDGSTDKRLSSEANVIEASLGCIRSSNNIDVVFLLDASGSVGSNHFNLALNWMVQFIEYFDESNLQSKAVRFGVATFNDDYTDHIYLNQYSTLNGYKTSILSIQYNSGGTSLGNALRQIALHQFTIPNGMREASKGVARLLIVLTDGKSGDEVAKSAAALGFLSLNIIVIGISSYDMQQLQQITIDDNIYALDTFTDLNTILSGITVKTCHIPTQLDVENNAIIQDIVVERYQSQYFEILLPETIHSNVILNITQQIGCVYIYISDTIQYPSYFQHDIKFASCSQSFKQIILAPNAAAIYIGIEGRDDVDALYDVDIGECNKTECETGTNYDDSLNNDDPYSVDITTSACNANCDVSDFVLKIEISFSFNHDMVYNIDAIECFIFDAINPFIQDVINSFDSCSISIDSVIGGQSDVFCTYPPCLWKDESSNITQRRLVVSQCSDANMTINAFTFSIPIINSIQNEIYDITDAIHTVFSDSFDICVETEVITNLLSTSPTTTKTTTKTLNQSEGDAILYVDTFQPDLTQTPVFAVSLLLGIVILIWTSLHFLCSGLDVCKNSQVGTFEDVTQGIWWPGRNKFMSFVSLVLIIWELVDFIFDLVTTFGILAKAGDPDTDNALYYSCFALSLFAFIFSVLLYYGKVQLWKLFYPEINVRRNEKRIAEQSMDTMKQKNRAYNLRYQDQWREYYKKQKEIGVYLGHLIMYDLFGVALEDCIQITVTWYIKNDLLFSNQAGFMTTWLWLTFIASLLSVCFKVFRALLLQLGCHHDAYRADLKPTGKEFEEVADLQVYQSPFLLRLRQKIPYETVPVTPPPDPEDHDTESINKYDQVSKALRKLDKESHIATSNNEWAPIREQIYVKYEQAAFQWSLQLLATDESMRHNLKERAIDEVVGRENQRIIDDMIHKGIDPSNWAQNEDLSHRRLYRKLIKIQHIAFEESIGDHSKTSNIAHSTVLDIQMEDEKKEEGSIEMEDDVNNEEEKMENVKKDSATKPEIKSETKESSELKLGPDGTYHDDGYNWFSGNLKRLDTSYDMMKETEWEPIMDEIQQQYEVIVLDWIYQELSKNDEIRNLKKEQAMTELSARENRRIVEELHNIAIHIDLKEYKMKHNISSEQELYCQLFGIKKQQTKSIE